MRPSIRMVLAVLACAAISFIGGAQPSQAEVTYPWCADYSLQGSSNCGFVTYQQCMAALSGNGGWCRPNPMFSPGPVPPYTPRR